MAWSQQSKLLRVACGVVGVGVATAATGMYLSDKNKDAKEEDDSKSSTKNSTSNTSLLKTIASKRLAAVDKHLSLGKVLASWTTNFEPGVKWDNNWDRRDPQFRVKPPKETANDADRENYNNKVKEATPTASRHLLFIRHGQYNLEGTKDAERYLTALGQDQANHTGLRLKELAHPYTKVTHSNMTRARQSAEIIHKHLPEVPMTVDEMLQEGAPIPPEPPIGNWRPEANFYSEGARIEAAFRKHFHRAEPAQKEDSHEIFVCHANVIRYFICRALQVPPEAWLRMSMYNGSVTWFSIRPSGRVSLRYHGDAGHMPPSHLTTN